MQRHDIFTALDRAEIIFFWRLIGVDLNEEVVQ